MTMSIKVCAGCAPPRVEQLSQYYGDGECQACGVRGPLFGYRLSVLLDAAKAAAADHIKEAVDALPAELRAPAVVGCAPEREVVMLNNAAHARDYFGHGGCDGFFFPAEVTVVHVHEEQARTTTVVCRECADPLLFTARSRGDELCGPCSRSANGTRPDADADRASRTGES